MWPALAPAEPRLDPMQQNIVYMMSAYGLAFTLRSLAGGMSNAPPPQAMLWDGLKSLFLP